jgi:hypothetical protein
MEATLGDYLMIIDGPVMEFAKTYGIKRKHQIALIQMVMEGYSYKEIEDLIGYSESGARLAVSKICQRSETNKGRYGIIALVYQIALGSHFETHQIDFKKVRREKDDYQGLYI